MDKTKAVRILDSSTGTLTISGTGEMDDYNENNQTKHDCEDQIKYVEIETGITGIGDLVFCDYSALTSIHVVADNQNYASEDGVLFNKNKTALICCPRGKSGSYTIPGNVRTIADGAFFYSGLTSVTIPNGVTSIGEGVFYCCRSLISVTIPDSVTNIGDDAFTNCSSLTSISIPQSVTSIGYEAFSDCSSLTSVVCYASTPPVISRWSFYGINVTACVLYVPSASLILYQQAPVWQDFYRIVALPRE